MTHHVATGTLLMDGDVPAPWRKIVAKHSAGDSSHGDSRTYGGSKTEATRNALEQKLVREGKVKPGTTPREKLAED